MTSTRLGFFLAILAAALQPAHAEVKVGEHILSLGGGIARYGSTIHTVNSSMDVDRDGTNDRVDRTAPIGETGIFGSIGYLYFPWRHWGIGVEGAYYDFRDNLRKTRVGVADQQLSYFHFGPSADGIETVKSHSTVQTLLLKSRYVFLPEEPYNPYLTIGAGAGRLRSRSDIDLNMLNSIFLDFRSSYVLQSLGPAFVVGAGCDADFSKAATFGVEAVWHYIGTDSEKFGKDSVRFWRIGGHMGYRWRAPF